MESTTNYVYKGIGRLHNLWSSQQNILNVNKSSSVTGNLGLLEPSKTEITTSDLDYLRARNMSQATDWDVNEIREHTSLKTGRCKPILASCAKTYAFLATVWLFMPVVKRDYVYKRMSACVPGMTEVCASRKQPVRGNVTWPSLSSPGILRSVPVFPQYYAQRPLSSPSIRYRTIPNADLWSAADLPMTWASAHPYSSPREASVSCPGNEKRIKARKRERILP